MTAQNKIRASATSASPDPAPRITHTFSRVYAGASIVISPDALADVIGTASYDPHACRHIHNARCMWIKTLGKEHGFAVPRNVDRYKVKPKDLVAALQRSSAGILGLLKFGCDGGGRIPDSASYVWRNLPLDVGHVLSYFVAHEGHHRGQIVMLARQLGFRLPAEVTGGLWQWTKRSREA